jgi:hypothetical protein
VANFIGITTGRSRRHPQALTELPFRTRFGRGPLEPAPATPTSPPRPYGDLTHASAEHILKIVRRDWSTIRVTLRERVAGVRHVLGYLAGFAGDDWQQRWQASRLDSGSLQTGELAAALGASPYEALAGIRVLFALRVVQPSLVGFRAHKFSRYPAGFRTAQRDPLLDEYFDAVAAHDVAGEFKREALFDVCCLLTVQGISLADLTPEALLHHAHERRRHGVVFLANRARTRFACLTAWDVLHRMGRLPTGAPATLRAALVSAPSRGSSSATSSAPAQSSGS